MPAFGPVNVPDLPGVPTGLNFASAFSPVISLLTGDITGAFAGIFPAQQWGIFQGGAPIIVADTVISVEYRKERVLADYPIEGGGFVSYDKVQLPFDCRIRYATGGTVGDKAAMIASIEAIMNDTQLYDVVTPETTYVNVNLSHVEYRRTGQQGMGLLQIDVWVLEVRLPPAAALSSPQAQSAIPALNGGSVSPTSPSQADVNLAQQGFPG